MLFLGAQTNTCKGHVIQKAKPRDPKGRERGGIFGEGAVSPFLPARRSGGVL